MVWLMLYEAHMPKEAYSPYSDKRPVYNLASLVKFCLIFFKDLIFINTNVPFLTYISSYTGSIIFF